ncbi:MAG TPA: hypothetical protein VGJ54_11270 [Streptosporangiaceae bacterium]
MHTGGPPGRGVVQTAGDCATEDRYLHQLRARGSADGELGALDPSGVTVACHKRVGRHGRDRHDLKAGAVTARRSLARQRHLGV